jgi:NADPH:quinone reductase-like Zn-dependent oxidoreductase
MKAIRIHKQGDPSVLSIDEIPVPRPAENEVLINIKAAALNHLDLWVRRGSPGLTLPLIMGSDAAGIITDSGSRVRSAGRYKEGDEVFIVPFRSDMPYGSAEELSEHYLILGEHQDGVQAEYVCAPADFIMPKPAVLSWQETAAFPLAFMTAYHMLVKKVRLESSQTILIWGASSGIGSVAIQIARLYGTRIISTAGSVKKSEFARQLGADLVINYKTERVSDLVREFTAGKGVDIVFEHVGEQSWPESVRSLKKGGKIITCGATTGARVQIDLRHLFIKHQQIIGSTMGNRQDLSEICHLIGEYKLKPPIGKVFPYDKIRQAHEFLESGQQMGKVVIDF